MNKFLTGLMASTIVLAGFGGTTFAATNATSTVTGTVAGGELSLSTPNNIQFTTTLNGADQSIALDPIATTITDYRGVDAGWDVSVQASNYETFKDAYALTVGGQAIDGDAATLDATTVRTQSKEESFATAAVVSKDANAGEFAVDLDWTLTPATTPAE